MHWNTLSRVRNFIHDSPLLHHDVFAKAKEESHPVVQSPAEESTPQSIHNPPSFASSSLLRSSSFPPKLVHSRLKEPITRAATFDVQPVRRPLSRCPSPQPSQIFISNSEGKRKVQKVDQIDDGSMSRGVSVASIGSNETENVIPKSVWSVDDPYLPRARPPPPLKLTKHQRNRSDTSITAPSMSSNQSSTFNRTSSRPSSKMQSRTSRSLRQSPDLSVLDISPKNSHWPDEDLEPPLTRESTRISTVSDSSSTTGSITFVPCELTSSTGGTPQPCWAGPSGAVSMKEDDGFRPVGGYATTQPTAGSGSKGDQPHIPTRLRRTRSLRKMRPSHLFDGREPKEDASATQEGPLLPGVVVSIQCYEHNRWHEKPVTDVIPKLRVLRLK